MRLREFITLFGSAALVQPLAACVQQTLPTSRFLYEGLPEPSPLMAAFRQGLLEAGIVEAGSAHSKTAGQRVSTIDCEISN